MMKQTFFFLAGLFFLPLACKRHAKSNATDKSEAVVKVQRSHEYLLDSLKNTIDSFDGLIIKQEKIIDSLTLLKKKLKTNKLDSVIDKENEKYSYFVSEREANSTPFEGPLTEEVLLEFKKRRHSE
jgi:hypothetical protein